MPFFERNSSDDCKGYTTLSSCSPDREEITVHWTKKTFIHQKSGQASQTRQPVPNATAVAENATNFMINKIMNQQMLYTAMVIRNAIPYH